jgi:CHAT domain-containing protein
MGGGSAAAGARGEYMPIRGAYMPVRGVYMPIRGAVGESKPATEAEVSQLRQLLDDLAKEEAALASAIRENVPAYAEAYSEIPTGSELIKQLAQAKDLAVLEYTFCDDGLVAIGLRAGQPPKVILIPVKGEDLWQEIGKFRQMIWERKPEANDSAVKLYETLVKPLEGTLTGAKRLWVVADGALQLMPFAALIGSDHNYLAARLAVATTPSLSLALSSRGARKRGTGALIAAAPDTGAIAATGDDARGTYMPIRGMYMPVRGEYMPIRGEGVSSALTAMAMVPLPGAKAEGEAIAQKLPGSVLLTDKEATKTRLLAEGGNCDLLHIATHGYADPEFPEFSGLLLAGEGEDKYQVLTAQEVYMWSLKARLVTLSACQTALGRTVEGEGVLGLTRAFIYAGAQDVLCTLWPVSDESTKALMVSFYDGLAKGLTVEEALQGAQSGLAANPATSHPFYWAGFVAVRGPE